jgi:hypothetical protein
MTSFRPAVALLVGLLAAPSAYAQTTPAAADVAQARELFTQATALKAKGDVPGAVAKFEQAHALVRTPVTAVGLARAYADTGKLVEAREVLLEVQRMPVGAEETGRSAQARKDAVALETALRGRLASVTILITGVPADLCTLTIDGAPMPSAAVGAPRLVNPGGHVVVATVGSSTDKAEVSLTEGGSSTVTLKLTAPPPPKLDAAASTPAPALVVDTHPLRTEGFIGVGLGAAGLVVGAMTGALSLSKASSVKSACPSLMCTTNQSSNISSGKTLGDVSTASFIVGGVLGAAGAFAIFYRGSTTEKPSATSFEVYGSPLGGGVRGVFW